MTDHERAARGQRALADMEQVADAFSAVRQAVLNELSQTSPGQPDKILKLHLAVQNLAAVKAAVQAVIDDGLTAQAAIAVAGLTRP